MHNKTRLRRNTASTTFGSSRPWSKRWSTRFKRRWRAKPTRTQTSRLSRVPSRKWWSRGVLISTQPRLKTNTAVALTLEPCRTLAKPLPVPRATVPAKNRSAALPKDLSPRATSPWASAAIQLHPEVTPIPRSLMAARKRYKNDQIQMRATLSPSLVMM